MTNDKFNHPEWIKELIIDLTIQLNKTTLKKDQSVFIGFHDSNGATVKLSQPSSHGVIRNLS